MTRPRFETLFARLMLAQTILILLVGLMFSLWLASSRSHVTAEPYAQLWAPNLIEALRQPQGAKLSPASPGYPLERQIDLPPGVKSFNMTLGPGYRLWQSEFLKHGLAIDDIRFVLSAGEVQMWFHTVQPGADPIWLGLPSPQLFPFLNKLNATVALSLVALVVGSSWWFARHVTFPLQQLSRRIRNDVLEIDLKGGAMATRESIERGATSEIRLIYNDYHQLLDRLRIAEIERGLLLAGVSHDLRSPLSRIRMAAELLPELTDPKPHIEIITRNVDHADKLIGSFLDFVRAGSLAMNETVDVVALAASVVARFGCPPELLCMTLAPERVLLGNANGLLTERLIFNLIDNGLMHGKAPVVVTVSAGRGHAGRDTVQIDVCDAGTGLPKGQEGALLKAFARGDPSRNRPGSGLGLSIVRQIVTRMEGTLVFTRDDRGHHVTVRF
jgi:two-component system osmolarity sensor histidine kinase EnvZ